MSGTITTLAMLIMSWAAVIIGASTIYGIVRAVKPDFDRKLWKK